MNIKYINELFESIFSSADPQSKEQLRLFSDQCEQAIASLMQLEVSEMREILQQAAKENDHDA